MLRGLYQWTLDIAAHRHARWGLAFVSFAESSFFPVPVDVVLIPMVLARRESAWTYALIALVTSVLGGIFGYAIGYFLFDTVGLWILNLYGLTGAFEDFAARYNEQGAWIVFIGGVSPILYKLITIASGVTQLNFAIFVIASVIARGLRFFVVCGLLWWFGPPIRDFIERYFGILSIVFLVILIGGFVLAGMYL